MTTHHRADDRTRWLALIERVNADTPKRSDLEAFAREVQANPDRLAEVADLAGQAHRHLAEHVPGGFFVRESVRRGIERTIEELSTAQDDPIEKQLVGHIATCWARLYLVQREYTMRTAAELPTLEGYFWEHRLSAAQARWLRALDTLARVRRFDASAVGRRAGHMTQDGLTIIDLPPINSKPEPQ